MTESAADFKARLIQRTGLTDDAVTAAWPDWWGQEAEVSASANAELRFSLARKLGLDARTLLGEQELQTASHLPTFAKPTDQLRQRN